MYKILVPTDFSEPSKVAVLYAAHLAKNLNAKITLLAVVNLNTATHNVINKQHLLDAMIEGAQDDAAQLIADINKKLNADIAIHFKWITGFPIHEKIELFVQDHDMDMIVMGTKGATGLKKVLIGSNAAAVIDNSSVPVIAVPDNVTFETIHKIVYATDLININEEIKTIAMFASLFNAEIHVLHVRPTDSINKLDQNEVVADLKKQAKYDNIDFSITHGDHIAEAVEKFTTEQAADLLVMFTHKLDFYEKLFGRGVTRELAFHGHVPLLTFNKTTLL
jgi:nucleotide-binding universal stress UspA family protein